MKPPLTMGEVKLHGNWSRPSTYTVIWALSLKDISYQYVEEDLTSKSPLLLQLNSLQQNLPVLVHAGKSISEFTVILEYIDETWPQNRLLPPDPLDRATARFWIRFIENKGPAVWRMFCYGGGKERKKAKQESLEMLQILEEQGIGEEKFFGGEKIGMVDLAFGHFAEWMGVVEELIGEKLMEADSFPRLEAWSRAFMEAPIIRENRPDRERMAAAFKCLRDRLPLQQPSLREFCTLFQCVLEIVSLLCRC